MKKKVITIMLCIFSMFILTDTSNALTVRDIQRKDAIIETNIDSYLFQFMAHEEETPENDSTETDLEVTYVGEHFCSEPEIVSALTIVGYLLTVAKLFVPIIIIGFGIFDLYKSIIAEGSDSLTKQLKSLGFRLIIGIFIFFIPTIINALLNQTGLFTSDMKECQHAILTPFAPSPQEEACKDNADIWDEKTNTCVKVFCSSYFDQTDCLEDQYAKKKGCRWDGKDQRCVNGKDS